MKKLELNVTQFDLLVKKMGATGILWDEPDALLPDRDPIDIELRDGKEIDLEHVDVGPGSLLAYQGRQILLYIKDTQSSKETLHNEPKKSRRYHVANCKTLIDMRSKGYFEKYVATNDTSGRFKVDAMDPITRQREETTAELKVCKNCLKLVNYSNYFNEEYAEKERIWKQFLIGDFLGNYSTFFTHKPSRTDYQAVPNNYVRNWSEISTRFRAKAGWQCAQCGVALRERKGLLHTHHRSGVVTDNSPKNLICLCVVCHAEQPHHGHMHVKREDREVIERLRVTQKAA